MERRNKPIRFAIYGCGFIANIHAAAVKSLADAELVGAADLFPAAAERFAEKEGIKAYEDLESLLQAKEVDAVCICTPNGTHADLAIRALTYHKNVVLEKPMAITTADCDRIIAAAEQSKGRLMVISQLRMAPDIRRARKIMQSGVLGRPILCHLSMRYYRSPEYYRGGWKGTLAMDGGAMLNQGVHGIDMLQYIAGPVKDARGITRTLFHQIEAEDTAVAALEFESGALGTLEATTAAYPGHDREIHIAGSRGYMDIRENCIERLVIDGEEQTCARYRNTGMSSDPTRLAYEDHAAQIGIFVRVLQGEELELVDEHEGRKAVEIIERVYA